MPGWAWRWKTPQHESRSYAKTNLLAFPCISRHLAPTWDSLVSEARVRVGRVGTSAVVTDNILDLQMAKEIRFGCV